MKDVTAARVAQALATLRLETAAASLDTHIKAAEQRDLSYLQFVDHLLADEIVVRQERSIAVRTKLAHFPTLKTLDSFDFDAQPSLDRKVINALQTNAYIERAENVVLLGPPGVGKTHLATGLGMRAAKWLPRIFCYGARLARSDSSRATRRNSRA